MHTTTHHRTLLLLKVSNNNIDNSNNKNLNTMRYLIMRYVTSILPEVTCSRQCVSNRRCSSQLNSMIKHIPKFFVFNWVRRNTNNELPKNCLWIELIVFCNVILCYVFKVCYGWRKREKH